MQTEMNACGCIFTYFHQLRKPHFLSGNVRDGMTIYWQASGRVDIRGWELTQRVQLFVLSIFVTRLISQFFVSDHLMLVNDSNRQLQEQVCWRASHFANHFNIFLQLFGSLKGSDNFMPAGLFFQSLDSAIELHSNYKCQWRIRFIHSDHKHRNVHTWPYRIFLEFGASTNDRHAPDSRCRIPMVKVT